MALFKRRLKDGSRTPTWYYDFRVKGRRFKGSTGCRDKALARRFEDELKAEARLGRPINGPAPKVLPTFAEYAKTCREGDGALKRSGSDDQSILDRGLVPTFGRMRLDTITRGDVERFRNERMAGKLPRARRNRKRSLAPATVAKELGLLRRILNVAVEAGLLDRNPVARLKMPEFDNRRDRVIDTTEYQRLLAAVDEGQGAHMRPIIVLAYETGMRQGEIVGLRWADVDLAGHFTRLPRTKNGEKRSVPLTETAEEALRAWGRRAWNRRESTYVFPSPAGDGPLGNVSAAFARLAKRARVAEVHFHDLRHTFATRMVERGVDLITLASITGHKTLAMLRRYSHPSDARKLALVRGAENSPHSHTTESEHPKTPVLQGVFGVPNGI
jgi:integrase